MNKTLKEQFLEKRKVKQGTMIDVTYVTYQNETFVNRYIFARSSFYSITDNTDADVFINYEDIDEDFEVFTANYKKANITSILEPTDYKLLYHNPAVVDITQAEIEKILGYKINIVEE